jgi:hypothetical protein
MDETKSPLVLDNTHQLYYPAKLDRLNFPRNRSIMLSVLLPLIMLSVRSVTSHECGNEGYTVTNYKNRGYLVLHKKGSESQDCFKCWRSGATYDVPYEAAEFTEYSAVCADDPKFYQVTITRYFLFSFLFVPLLSDCFDKYITTLHTGVWYSW